VNDKALSATLGFPPDDEAERVRHMPLLLRGRPAQEVAILQWCYLCNGPIAVVGRACGLPPESISRVLAQFNSDTRALGELLQPPHAAD
jgi:hypothetical protein